MIKMVEIEKNVSKAMNWIANGPVFNTTLKSYEVDYWLENYSDTVFVCGMLRQVVFTKVTDNMYKIKTEAI